MIASVRQKQQRRMTVHLPVVAQCMQQRLRQRDVAVLGSLAAMDVHHHPLRINVPHLQVQRLFQPQSQGIDGPEVDGHPPGGAAVDDLMDLINGQHFRQSLRLLDLHPGQRLPVPPTGAGIEKLDAVEAHPQRAAGKGLVILQIQEILPLQEILPQLILGNLVGRTLAEVGQLPHGPQIAFMSPLRHPSQMQILTHPLVQGIAKPGRMSHRSFRCQRLSWRC